MPEDSQAAFGDILELTRQFMEIGGQLESKPRLNWSNERVRELRIALMAEEVREYGEAEKANDPVEAIDGLLDIIVIAMGTLMTYVGPDTARALLEVVGRSNLSKFVEGEGGSLQALFREDGKILKGPNFFAPTEAIRVAALPLTGGVHA